MNKAKKYKQSMLLFAEMVVQSNNPKEAERIISHELENGLHLYFSISNELIIRSSIRKPEIREVRDDIKPSKEEKEAIRKIKQVVKEIGGGRKEFEEIMNIAIGFAKEGHKYFGKEVNEDS